MNNNQDLPDLKRQGSVRAGQFPPGQSGNPKGRPKGIVDKRQQYKALFEQHSEALAKKAIQLALDGDPGALRLCLERVAPTLKARDLPIRLESLNLLDSPSEQGRAILNGVATGDITPDQAESLFRSLSAQTRISELTDLVTRIEVLEQRVRR